MAKKARKTEYPSWICGDCGDKYGRWPKGHLATFHEDVCGWCGETKMVTEPRDYSYPMTLAEYNEAQRRNASD